MARATGSRKAATAKRPRREIKLPAKYSHAFPVATGAHNYTLRAIPLDVWTRAQRRAYGEDQSIRSVLIRMLDLYGSGRLNI